jgi:hypothetical protein
VSGGFFEYDQLLCSSMAEELQKIIDEEEIDNIELVYSKDTLQEFKNAIRCLKRAGIYAYRLDCLLANDDNEDTFHNLLKKELLNVSEDVQ